MSDSSVPTETTTPSLRAGGRLVLGLFVVVGGIAFSVLLSWFLLTREQKLAEVQFKLDAGKRIEALQRTAADRLATINILAAFFTGSELVERQEFLTFAAPIMERHPGIEMLAWVPHIPAAQRESHEQAIRKENLAKYEINQYDKLRQLVPAGNREAYFPILFSKTAKKAPSLIGLDLGSNKECRHAILQAMTTRRQVAVVCPPLNGRETAGYRLYVVEPAWNENKIPTKRPADQPEIDGIVLGVFYINALVEDALQNFVPVGIDIYLVGPPDASGKDTVYARLSPLHTPNGAKELAVGSTMPPAGGMHLTSDIDIAGLQCTVVCVPMASYLARQRTWGPIGVLLGGLMITGLLTVYLWSLTDRIALYVADRKRLAETVQESERKLRAVLNQTFQFIGLVTPKGLLTSANETALAFAGVSEAEVCNKPFWETPWWAHSPELQEKLRQAVSRAAQGKFVRLEVTNRAKQGDLHWIDFSLKPIENDTGEVAFLIAEGRNITDRKQAEEVIHQEQRLLHDLLDLHERERKLMAYEIHDGLAQQLTAAVYKFQTAEHLYKTAPDTAMQTCNEGLQLLREAMAETRRLISGLRPPVLDESGVVDAIDYLIAEHTNRGGPEIEFVHATQFDRLAAPLESAVFRIVQECLTNACRHSQSDKVCVKLWQTSDRVHVDVQDWGVGFDPAQVPHGHFGLQGIHERARLLDGAATIQAAPQQGVHITVELPLISQGENGTARHGGPI